jgi:hypothetical protein
MFAFRLSPFLDLDDPVVRLNIVSYCSRLCGELCCVSEYLNFHFDHPSEGSCLAESKFATGPIVCDHPLFDLFPLSIAMGAIYDLLGNVIDVAPKVRFSWAIGNLLIKNESDHS